MSVLGFDHVQLAMPAGGEETADRFYVDLLGFAVEPKPAALAGRGGRWYRSGGAQMHLGVEEPFTPARKAHPALLVDDLDGLTRRLAAAGVEVRADAALNRPRVFVDDPFGNRIELIAARP